MKKTILYLICLTLTCNISTAQSPYAYYPLNGNANDTTSNHLNGTINGTPTLTTNQYNQPNTALLFNGSTDYIVLPTIFDFPYRTVIGWFRASVIGSSNNENIIYMADNTNVQNGLTNITTHDNSGVSEISMSCDQYGWVQPADTGVWYQCAITRSPLVLKFFINGALVDSGLNPNGVHSTNQTTYEAVIGADREFNGLFNGKIDDVAIYDTVLSDAAIKGIYTAIAAVHQIDDALRVYTQTGDVFVQLPESLESGIRSVALYDILGKELSSTSIYPRAGKLNDSPLSSGTYIVAVYPKGQEKPICRKVTVVR